MLLEQEMMHVMLKMRRMQLIEEQLMRSGEQINPITDINKPYSNARYFLIIEHYL